MAKGFDVIHAKSAVKARNKFDLSRTHLTTMNFGEIVPLFTEETVPGDSISVKGSYFSRMAPLVKPTYGKFSFKTVAGFVPYHQIADDADAFMAGKNVWEGEAPLQRHITLNEFCKFLRFSDISVELSSANTEGFSAMTVQQKVDASDFVWASGSTVHYSRFTDIGRYFVKVLNSLGYVLPQKQNAASGSTWAQDEGKMKLSAYPLLAFFKLYNDYMSQSVRYNISELSAFLRAIKHNNEYMVSGQYAYDDTTGEILAVGLHALFSNLRLAYENDYFTSAWQNANQPVSYESNKSAGTVPGYGEGSTYALYGGDDTDLYTPIDTSEEYVNIGQRALDWLKSFDDWVRRNNYSGSRAVQQVYSRFGIKTDDYRSNYAYVISTDMTPVQVGDITNTAGADGTTLGEYAGKGIMSSDKAVSYKANDYGLLIILGYFTVLPMNAYGFDAKVLRTSPFDYYNPEFDGIGAQAIPLAEFYASPIVVPTGDSTNDFNVYGFTERYNSYRYGRDLITGDFRNFHDEAGNENVWHTGRLLTNVRQSGNLVAQNANVNMMAQSGNEFNRMFSITDGGEDKFYLTANFNVDAIRPMLNLSQVPRLGTGDTTVPRNGNTIS